MNPNLQLILSAIESSNHYSAQEKSELLEAIKTTDKALTISEFKLERTEKVKRTTAILLEETIEELEQKRKTIEESNIALQKSLEELKAAQAQLIQSEKMASLGELTAGIAHEIQNPLNFVNNFSEVSKELLEDMQEELDNADYEEVKLLATDVIQNLEKIMHHGKRAEGIVKGMLQHSRKSEGKKEPTDINALVDEYLRLAYHGHRAKDKTFNAQLETNFDQAIGKMEIVPQDMGRVVLNLITNAFYAVNQRKKDSEPNYVPKVMVGTIKNGSSITISVNDNGIGMKKNVLDKIFQPFFTTKPTGEGTGLGLSLSYDIIESQGGKLKVDSVEGQGSTFTINLPN